MPRLTEGTQHRPVATTLVNRKLRLRWWGLLPVLMVALLSGCDEEFKPNAPFEERLVIYGMLNSNQSQHFVRILKSYDATNYNPYQQTSDPQIAGALIELIDGKTRLRLRDTLVAREDTSRYKDKIHAYVLNGFRPLQGRSYSLSVATTEHGTVVAPVTIPDQGIMTITNYAPLVSLSSSNPSILGSARISANTYGYLVRMFVDYEVREPNGAWIQHRFEMPVVYDSLDATRYQYPTYKRNLIRSYPYSTALFGFPKEPYVDLVEWVLEHYLKKDIRNTLVWFYLYEIDKNLYNYYSIANNFQDEYSIRVDMPDYVSIKGAYGVFGGISVDSLSIPLRW